MAFFSGFYIALMAWVYEKKIKTYLFYILVGVFAGIFSTYFSHDSLAYQGLFLGYSTTPFSNTFHEITGHELFFVLSSKVLSFLPALVFFCLYAVVSFAIKLTLIEKASRYPLLSLLCYFAFFFLYLDGTVIRVSLGIAVAYWGIYLLSKNNVFGFFAVITLSSFLFHYSLIVLLIMPLFRNHHSILFTIALTFIFLALFYFDYGVLDLILTSIHHLDTSYVGVNKLVSYLNRSEMSHPYSIIFGSLFIASLVGYFLFRKELSEFELISFNMLFLSFLCLVALYESQVLQNRFSEIFRYSLIFVAPLFYEALTRFSVKPRWAMGLYCLFLSGYFFYYYYFKGIISDKNLGLLQTYFF